jgi:hypothetical protein
MKKFMVVIIFLALTLPVFGQTNTGTSDLYYFNVPVEKIYPSNQGYIIQYRKGVNSLGTIGIPNSWVSDAGGRAEIIKLPAGKNWPTMSVFYSNGEFSHVRLYVHKHRTHQTWGNVPMGTDVSRYFQDVDSFRIEF